MKIIRAIDCRTTRWKNGGGSTTEIAAEPAGASLDTFDWRISMAQVASDGPFSEFAGIDRTLAVVRGRGLMLTIGANAPVTLGRGSDPVQFAGDLATSARLVAGEITDLNVMTRRRRFSHRLLPVREPFSGNFDNSDIAIVVSLDGRTNLTSGQDFATLDRGDAAILLRSSNAPFRIAPTAPGECYLVLLRERGDQPG
ncbi:HutD family protein [Bradyrhizobium sp. dw_78]|uniref:HutD/Ves family protein n=1 Tax=Bradyrhizobium sp. dw_78 TaxID=2719793 RepID=UPI001BD25C81|nr:HutD family protein [Bradyrhizobium sp. dw_78]